jgi:hypothetical protein
MAKTSHVQGVVSAFLASSQSIDAANASLVSAKASLLSSLQSALKGADPVDDDVWAKDWAEPVGKALIASGRYTVDDKGQSLSARSAASTLKVAVIAITNEFEIEPGDTSLKSFVQRVRPLLADDDLIPAPTAGAKKKDGERKSNTREAALDAACFLAAGKDRQRAKMLKLIMGSHAEAFDDWADAFVVDLHNANKGRRTRR